MRGVLLLAAVMLAVLAVAPSASPVAAAGSYSPCQYCKYCAFCDQCAKCPCKASKKKPNCGMCGYCKYCSMCKLCSLCSDGGLVDQIAGAFSSLADYLPASLASVMSSDETKAAADSLSGIDHEKIAADLKTVKLSKYNSKKLKGEVGYVHPTDRDYYPAPVSRSTANGIDKPETPEVPEVDERDEL